MEVRSKNILIIEDSPIQTALIQRSFEENDNFNLFIVKTLREARKFINYEVLDLLISDAWLPDGKGTDLLTMSIRNKNIPIVIMTSNGNEKMAVDSLKKGAHHYIVKSAEMFQELPQLALRWIGERQAIEERRQQELELIEKQVELEESNKELRRIAYSISHDLATPIIGIVKLSKWIEDDLQSEDIKVKDNLGLLRKRALRLKRFMDTILEYSKLSEMVELETVKVSPLVEEIVNSLDVPQDTVINIGPLPNQIRANQFLFSKLFQSLIQNAFQHNPDMNVTIDITWEENEKLDTFSVIDNGKGIEPKHQESIFEMFQILEKRDKNERIGAGLTIAKRIVDNSNGKLWVESSPGIGSCFKFSWPKAPVTNYVSDFSIA